MSASLDAYYQGNEDVFFEWVERHIEHAPDGLLRNRLKARMPRTSEEFYPHAFLYYLKHHKHRLGAIDDPARLDQIRSGMKLFDSLGFALDVLCAGSKTTREQMLDRMIQFTLRSEADKPPRLGLDPNKHLVNEVGNLIRREARREGNSNQRLASLDNLPELSDTFEDPSAVAPYIAVEHGLLLATFAELARQRLTPTELEVFEYRLSGLSLKEIADRRGVAEGTVRSQWHTIRHKLLA